MISDSPVPEWNGKDAAGAAGWSDAATVIPWALYLAYGDRRVLEEQYESMAHWVEYERGRSGGTLIWKGDFQFSDWADFGFENRFESATNGDLVATAYFAHSVDLLSRAARVLGKTDEAVRYTRLLGSIRAAFDREFVAQDGTVGSGTQAAYVLALEFGLLPSDQNGAAAKRLVKKIHDDGHLTTGFLATPWLLFALSEHGYLDEAYQLLLRTQSPSWLYPIKRGATTMWERWDGIKADGSFDAPGMNSFNHYAYGAVGEWMYRVIAGINIDPAAPGYKHILIRPQPGGGLTSARASHLTPYGKVSSSWRIQGDTFRLAVVIPPNSTASLYFPSSSSGELLESGQRVAVGNGIAAIREVGTDAIVDLASGRYEFSYALSNGIRERRR